MLVNELQLLKEEIYNCGYVPTLLEKMGCVVNGSTSNSERVESSRPDGDNNRSVQVYLNEYLTSRVRSKAHVPINDIYDLVSYLRFGKTTSDELRNNIPQAKKYIINVLGLTNFRNNNESKEDDPNDWLKQIQKKRKQRVDLDAIELNPILPQTVLNEFVQMPHQKFYKDGISLDTQKEFEIGFDLQSERITIPVRDKNGNLIGIKGRATRQNDEESFKYLPIYAYQKSKVWFNLHRAMPYILEKNEVICFESEKSCLKAYDKGYYNTISQQGSEISKIQAEMLKRINPDLKVILAYDQDKGLQEIKQMAKVFGDYDNIYGIYDVEGLLDNKQSPTDASYEIFDKLLNEHCYRIPIK